MTRLMRMVVAAVMKLYKSDRTTTMTNKINEIMISLVTMMVMGVVVLAHHDVQGRTCVSIPTHHLLYVPLFAPTDACPPPAALPHLSPAQRCLLLCFSGHACFFIRNTMPKDRSLINDPRPPAPLQLYTAKTRPCASSKSAVMPFHHRFFRLMHPMAAVCHTTDARHEESSCRG